MGQYYRYIAENCNRTIIGEGDTLKLMESAYLNNPELSIFLESLYENPMRLAFVGDYARDEFTPNPESLPDAFLQTMLYNQCWPKDGSPELMDVGGDMPPIHRYIINHTKKLFIDVLDYIALTGFAEGRAGQNSAGEEILTGRKSYGFFTVHPLSILCAVGNGQGGGDYFGINDRIAGSWAWDFIELSDNPDRFQGYAEFHPCFSENVDPDKFRKIYRSREEGK